MSKLDEAIAELIGKSLIDPAQNSDLETKTIQYDPDGMPNSQRAYNQAAIEGLNVVLPASNELLIDIDNEHSYMLFNKQIQIVQAFIGVVDIREQASKSGQPYKLHITVELDKDVTGMERLALQAMLGSDRVRELLGYVQEKNGDPHPVLFLEKRPITLSLAEGNPLAADTILRDEEIPY